MKKFSLLMLLLVAALSFAGCEGKEPEQPETAVASIVTYESTEGSSSVFTYTDNAGGLITLTAAWKGAADLKPGSRVLIYYRAEAYGVSGPVSLLSVVKIPGGDPKPAEKTGIPKSEPLKQCAAWLSGSYLNLSAIVALTGKASEVGLYVDEATLAGAVPTACVVVRADGGSVEAGVEKRLYASWDVSTILALAGNEGLNVCFTDSSGNESIINITR